MKYTIVSDKIRQKIFEYFSNFNFPFLCITFEINITKFKEFISMKGLKFSSPILYILLQSCNKIKEFKRRILNDDIIEYDKVAISFPYLNKDN
ncbi:MAG: hypothetical protein GY756_02320 [bacterium]|nr:hypothetical protein [bacterium]